MSSMTEKRVKRIAKACIKCHERKVKCSGDEPCLRCFKENKECVYIRQPKPRKPRRKKAEMIKELSGDLPPTSAVASGDGKVSAGALALSELEIGSARSGNSFKIEVSGKYMPLDSVINETQPYDNVNLSQPSFTPFSRRGIKWIVSSLKLEESDYKMGVVNVFLAAVHTFQKNSVLSSSMWVTPVSSVLPIPPKEVCLLLTASYFNKSMLFSHVISEESVLSYFEKYFDPTSPSKSLGYAEMLIMNVVLAFGITLNLEEFETITCPSRIKELLEMKKHLLKNCVYLYQRIAVIGDGFTGIQALLLLVLYGHMTLGKISNYMMISTVVRLAQEIGLHRQESYYALSDEAIGERLIVWWCCYFIDKTHCLVSGKPPVINDADVSVLYPEEFLRIAIFYRDQNLSPSGIMKIAYILKKNASNKKILDQIEKIDLSAMPASVTKEILFKVTSSVSNSSASVISFHLATLSTIGAKYYDSLLCPGVTCKSCTRAEFEGKISALNTDLEAWRCRMPEELRPGSHIDLQKPGVDSDPNLYLLLMTLHFSYYSLLMTINRMTSLPSLNVTGPQSSDASSNSVELSVFAASRILELAKTIEIRLSHFWNFNLAPTLTAVTVLFCYCIKYPTASGMQKRVILLAESVRLLFVLRQKYLKFETNNAEWESLHRVFSIFVFFLVETYKKHFGAEDICDDKGLNSYILSVAESMKDFLNPSLSVKCQQKQPYQLNFANGFYTLNCSSNAVPPDFSYQSVGEPLMKHPISTPQETPYQNGNNFPIEKSTSDQGIPLNLFQNFEFMSDFNNYWDNNEVNAELASNIDAQNNPSFDNNSNVMSDNLDYQENNYLYQSVFNMPFAFLGEPNGALDDQSLQASVNNFNPL